MFTVNTFGTNRITQRCRRSPNRSVLQHPDRPEVQENRGIALSFIVVFRCSVCDRRCRRHQAGFGRVVWSNDSRSIGKEVASVLIAPVRSAPRMIAMFVASEAMAMTLFMLRNS